MVIFGGENGISLVEDVSIESSKMKLVFPLKYEFDDGIKVAQALK